MNQKKYKFESLFSMNSNYEYDFHKKICEYDNWNIIHDRYDRWSNKTITIHKPIPKLIHQIWLGSKVPKKYDKWRDSWKIFNPDYVYKLWSEDDILDLGLKNEAAFLGSTNLGVKSDIARYEILHKLGGIYVDTDFECLRSFETLRCSSSFFAGQGFDYKPHIFNGILGATPGHKFYDLMINAVREPVLSQDPMDVLRSVGVFKFTEIFFNNFNEMDEGSVIFPSDYFYPWPNYLRYNSKNRYKYVTNSSFAIHHWEVSWTRQTLAERIFKYVKNRIAQMKGV
jgi:mannosyltransferase OCH1-like enzyme